MVNGALEPSPVAEQAPTSGVKIIRLRYAGTCGCGHSLPAGTQAGWDPATRRVVCAECVSVSGVPAQRPPPPAETGQAGASLEAEYRRRRAAQEARLHAAHPHLAPLLRAVSKEPTTTTAFKVGADAERRAAEVIARSCGDDVHLLFNRRLGRGRQRGDIDMIAIAAEGVFVIDVKCRSGAEIAVRCVGGLLAPVRETLLIGGRDRTCLLDSLARQLDAVRSALEDFAGGSDVPVHTALCFVDARLPVFGALRIGGVPLLTLRGTARMLRKTRGPLDPDLRLRLYAHLENGLPPAN